MKILRRQQQADAIGASRWTVRRIQKEDPTYPVEVEVSPGIRGVIEDEFIAWLKSKPLRSPARFAQHSPLARVLKAGADAWRPPAKAEPLHDAHVREFERVKGKRARGAAK